MWCLLMAARDLFLRSAGIALAERQALQRFAVHSMLRFGLFLWSETRDLSNPGDPAFPLRLFSSHDLISTLPTA
jgi:hypothetical protein